MINISRILVSISVILILFISCNQMKTEKHFITDPDYRKLVLSEFEKVKDLAKGRHDVLFSVFNNELNLEEEEALKFLYAFMPLNDLANENGEFFLKNIRSAFTSRDSFSWGKDIPEDIFRHFVLPHRINNEDVDSARAIFLKELHPRIKDMDITSAALEVNHWCHEKVSYHPTNIRTMAPLGVIKTAYGRCGEESTFTVTALRSVGIPARQVYTPRWAHADDNHAWVEVYINGKWQYLGACEPMPILNIGWFDAPVKRAMMVHTKAFGKYRGNESILNEHDKYSILNLLENYVPVKNLIVKVTNDNGQAMSDVCVEFGLYNYAEYYPLKISQTNNKGVTSIKTGYGDIRIMVSDTSGNFDIKNITVEKVDTVEFILTRKIGQKFSLNIDNVPPAKKEVNKPASEKTDANAIRLQNEDSIREIYINSFYTQEQSNKLAGNLNLSIPDVYEIMKEARGNHVNIVNYLMNSEIGYDRELVLSLLNVIESKDLHDVSTEVLIDHLHNYTIFSDSYSDTIKSQYILNPRILNERLTSYKGFLRNEFSNLKGLTSDKIVNEITSWTNEKIYINNSLNYYETTLSPVGVYNLKVSDESSRDIFVVAVLRSLGIPARIETTMLIPQYFNSDWKNIIFSNDEKEENSSKAIINFTSPPNSSLEANYRIHFGLAKFNGKQFVTLDFGWETKLSNLDKSLEVEPGYYQFTTGNRLPNGTVLVSQQFFKLSNNESKDLLVELRHDSKPIKVLANLEIEEEIKDYKIFIWIDPTTEPGKHLINDFKISESTFISREIPIVFYYSEKNMLENLQINISNEIEIVFDDNNTKLLSNLKNANLTTKVEKPVVLLINNKGELLFYIDGYNIGTPDQLLKVVDKL